MDFKNLRLSSNFLASWIGIFLLGSIWAGGEYVCSKLNDSPSSHKLHFQGIGLPYFNLDPILGYKPTPNAVVEATKEVNGKTIYQAIYSIDRFSRRITPVKNKADKFLLFFGGSFTFGEGVNDNETLPYYVVKEANQYQPYNYGFHGYGPQEMLAKLESKNFASELTQKQGHLIYSFIDPHVERAAGSMYVYNGWGKDMPYFCLGLP